MIKGTLKNGMIGAVAGMGLKPDEDTLFSEKSLALSKEDDEARDEKKFKLLGNTKMSGNTYAGGTVLLGKKWKEIMNNRPAPAIWTDNLVETDQPLSE